MCSTDFRKIPLIKNPILCLIAAALAASCAPTKVERHTWVTGLKPEKAEYYHKLHKNPWPTVTATIKECNIRNFSIYEREITGKTYLIAYLEYTGEVFAADMKKWLPIPRLNVGGKKPIPANRLSQMHTRQVKLGPIPRRSITSTERTTAIFKFQTLSMLLQDKVIFLTGGSTGIGLECAKAYAAEGAKVALVARNGDLSTQAAAEVGPEHLGFACDVSNDAKGKSAIARVLGHFGKIDAIHNNAGIATPSKPLDQTSDEEWDALFDINLKSLLYTTRHGIAALRETKGCILNTSSLVGVIGQEIHAAYTATKGAMNTLTKSMALDYAKDASFITGSAYDLDGGMTLLSCSRLTFSHYETHPLRPIRPRETRRHPCRRPPNRRLRCLP